MVCCPRIMIAGAGNWLLGHDRVGPRVLAAVEKRYGSEVGTVDIGTSPLALLDHLDRQDLVVIIDACVGYGESGEVMIREPELRDDELRRGASIHQIGPLEALVVASHLEAERMPLRIRLILVETTGLDDAGEERACAEVIAVLDDLLAQYSIHRRPQPGVSHELESRDQDCPILG